VSRDHSRSYHRGSAGALLGWNISLELRLREVEAGINVPLRALTSVPAVLRKLVKP
jgi:hypothetical protein